MKGKNSDTLRNARTVISKAMRDAERARKKLYGISTFRNRAKKKTRPSPAQSVQSEIGRGAGKPGAGDQPTDQS